MSDTIHDPFVHGDERVAIHAITCGTSTTNPGHCHLDCECWCHGPIPNQETP